MGNTSGTNNQKRGVRTSVSLRSLSNFLNKKFTKQHGIDDTNITYSYTDYNREVFGPSIKSIFLPEFQYRSDICKSDFKFLKKLGQGTFSTVYLAKSCSWRSADIVAVKVQSKQIIASKGAEKQITRETQIHKILNDCDFLAKYYDCWQTATHLFTVMEYVDGDMDLYQLWNETTKISEAAIRIYAAEIATALDYLRSKQVLYRDLKMENIALNQRKHIKLIDFGFARAIDSEERATTICGTLEYMAVEMAKGECYSFPADWWCFGVLLYILVERRYPFPNGNATDHKSLTFEADLVFSSASPNLSSLISKLLTLEPENRLSDLERFKSEPLFKDSFDFAQLQNMNIDLNATPTTEKKSTGIFALWI